jgi:ubiquinone/menaquinone biosynthesis C-methylase UbiE
MNVFENTEIASNYDSYYSTEFGAKVDDLEKKLIQDLLSDVPHRNMLELGCGTGHWTKYFAEHGYTITAIDISDAMLTIAKTKQIANTQFIKANSCQLPFSNHSFSLIVSITMLEFVENIELTIQEMFRVLKPHGTLILGCLNEDSVLGQTKHQSETFRSAHFFTRPELYRLLLPYGEPVIKETVFLDHQFQFAEIKVNGVFLGVKVTKKDSL